MSLKCFFQSLCPRYIYRLVVLKNNSLWTVDIIFISKFLGGFVLRFQLNQRNENRINCFVLKRKTTERNSAAISYLRLVKNNYLLFFFFHFSDLRNLVKCMDGMFSCYFLTRLSSNSIVYCLCPLPPPHVPLLSPSYNGGT